MLGPGLRRTRQSRAFARWGATPLHDPPCGAGLKVVGQRRVRQMSLASPACMEPSASPMDAAYLFGDRLTAADNITFAAIRRAERAPGAVTR